MVNQPHKYRCETCNYRKIIHNYGLGTDRPRCELTKWFLDTPYPEMSIEKEFIGVVGCYSHSDAIKVEQRIADVIAELEKARCAYHDETIDEHIDTALALLRGKGE